MLFQLSDIYIKADGGNFPVSQKFGNKLFLPTGKKDQYGKDILYDVYAVWGMKGHNGSDFALPSMIPTLSAADGYAQKIAYDPSGYGYYVKVVHNGFYTRYGHLNSAVCKVGDRIVAGQLIAYSNNSGKSTEAHLHFEVAPCDEAGNETESNNGFLGRIDPMGNRCQWTIHNYKEPVIQKQVYNGDEVVKVQQEANLNWDIVLAITSKLGIQADANNKRLTAQIAQDFITSLYTEIANKTREDVEHKKNYEESQRQVIALKNEMEAINKEDGDYAKKAYEFEQLANKRGGFLRDIAGVAKIENTTDEEKSRNEIIAEFMRLQDAQDGTQKGSVPQVPLESPVYKVNETVFTKIKDVLNQYIKF